jgi:hypothetical protein
MIIHLWEGMQILALKGSNGLWARMKKLGYDTDSIWKNISGMIIKSLVAVDDKMTYQPCAFEVFGYDVLIDQDLRPWLIEVNASPSMSRDSALDYRVKDSMIQDTISLVDPPAFDRAAVARVMKRRMSDVASSKFVMGRSDPHLESDLHDILGDTRPRKYGEDPRNMGSYEWLAPNTKLFDGIMKQKTRVIKTEPKTSSKGLGQSQKK